MKKVSVVIPCYNSSDTIYRCWRSIKEQSIGINNIECIFVDDCSTDNGKTFDILKSIEKEEPDSVRVISSDRNRGPGGARNIGLAYATGIYLHFTDSDDELCDETLEKLYNIARTYDTDIIQYNEILIVNDKNRLSKASGESKFYNINTSEERVNFLNSTKVTYGCKNKFYNLDFIKKCEVRFAEDVVYEEPLFVYPLFLYAKKIYLCEEGLYKYHLHPNSIVTSQIGKKILDHPKVQLLVLEDCMKRSELYAEYKDVIACYFLWSFYCETLLFAAEHEEAFVPIEYFNNMQEICMKLFPDWENNSQLKNVDKSTNKLLKSLNYKFASQGNLEDYIGILRTNPAI